MIRGLTLGRRSVPVCRAARRGDEDGRPEEIGIELDQPEHHRLGAQRQQRRRDEGDDEDGGQAEFRQRQQRQQPVDPGFHQRDYRQRGDVIDTTAPTAILLPPF